ncbi:MAG: transglutaminase-like cysteine peptidase [Bradyrhizobium sp.]|uniref:transglutaminase-like cysteine peptidase n=1 Tax=Bradyrhizobium sp. TaxID=376 RepID=UPI001C297BF1|nr:transglutaminase-like cysteine peptidase [Bradyrhizobium sp.]MBU6461119.1 transglutaminase-like cysteine peptidase [Pseudomonadota bacterium]MDE2066195.1 transglutaminase-like cysteine peptidase [Bradyrhizobium sp.]MDE2472635.1 transglutaminase-like cysteine peptidase [Bradyrhizobium sp.]
MRTISKWLVAIITILVLSQYQSANAGFVGMPSSLGLMMKRISFSNYTLPPMAFTQFCLRYEDQCKPQRMIFRGGPVRLTSDHWEDLRQVNRKVNSAIIPERNTEGLAGEKWLIHPARGDCNDYAVTKRSDLLKRGWPARSLLLSEVVTPWGEHHLVLVVRTSAGDLVLDNMTPQIRPWAQAPYQWVRIQTPKNPNYWASLGSRSV